MIRFQSIIGNSSAIEKAKELGYKAANVSVPVFIQGESGVGKELFANAIHNEGNRSQAPFVAVNCGAIPSELVESILFGHEKGAFTGANNKSVGKFREANGGTLFLDEVGELRLETQVKLLRALQSGEIEPVGSNKSIHVDVRIISATNRDLKEAVSLGAFREDLYYRLNVLPLMVPSLRERREDIELLIAHFLNEYAKKENVPHKTISPSAMMKLINSPWPGNVRQLQNAIYQAATLSDQEEIQLTDFFCLWEETGQGGVLGKETIAADNHSDNVICNDETAGESGETATAAELMDSLGHVRPLVEVEKEWILFALNRYEGRLTEVAKRLGIGRSTLYRKMAEYGLASYKNS